jgi:hypothetical protein
LWMVDRTSLDEEALDYTDVRMSYREYTTGERSRQRSTQHPCAHLLTKYIAKGKLTLAA